MIEVGGSARAALSVVPILGDGVPTPCFLTQHFLQEMWPQWRLSVAERQGYDRPPYTRHLSHDEEEDLGTVVSPHFRNTDLCIDWKLVERGVSNINFNDKVWWWINAQINFGFAADLFFMLNIKTGIWLESSGEICAFKRRRTSIDEVNLHFLCKNGDNVGKGSIDIFMFEGQYHNFEYPSVVGEVSGVTVLKV